MAGLLSRLFPPPPERPLIPAGIYHRMNPQSSGQPTRLHLRVEPDGRGVLLVNASTVLHLNETATTYAWHLVQGQSLEKAAAWASRRFRIGRGRARRDAGLVRDQIEALAEGGEHDPVLVLGMERADPYERRPSAPYRLDLALTFRTGDGSSLDPQARRRVDRELGSEEWTEVIRRAWAAGVPHLVFTGGEPSLRPDLAELIRTAEGLGQVTGVVTQGARLTDAARLQEFSQAGTDHLVVVVDPRQAASLEGLQRALDSDVFTSAHLTLDPATAGELETVLDRLQASGVSHISVTSPPGAEAGVLLDRAYQELAERGLTLVWDLPVPFSSTNPVRLEAPDAPGARAWLYVEPDGDVVAGQNSPRVLGNALREDLLDLWRLDTEAAL